MRRIKTKKIKGAATLYRGSLMLLQEKDLKIAEGQVEFAFSERNGVPLMSLMFKEISILTEINSDHIQMMKEIINIYERSF